ncbi:MAG: DUF434 domain-containing protein [Candidatus Methanoperedens sp.]|nr:DUF434 domain-containing protein [Candidatus Methanoperedens sp.]
MNFGDSVNLREAAADIRYLLDRGYPQKGAVVFVCAHYRLDTEAMYLLLRTVVARETAEKRKAKFLPCNRIEGNNIIIDGYNIIIGMESILEKKAYLCDDEVTRDIKGISRNYKVSEITEKAIELILQFLKENQPAYVCFLLDSQISKSGQLASALRRKMQEFGLKGDAKTSNHVDYDLKTSKYIVASSDGVIIDEAEKVVNFLSCIVSRFRYLEAGVERELFYIKNPNLRDEIS